MAHVELEVQVSALQLALSTTKDDLEVQQARANDWERIANEGGAKATVNAKMREGHEKWRRAAAKMISQLVGHLDTAMNPASAEDKGALHVTAYCAGEQDCTCWVKDARDVLKRAQEVR